MKYLAPRLAGKKQSVTAGAGKEAVTSFTYLGIKEKAIKVNEFTEIKDSPPTLLDPLYLMFSLNGDLFLPLDYFFRIGSLE